MADRNPFFYAIVVATVLSIVWAWLRRRRRRRIARRIAAAAEQRDGVRGQEVLPATSSVPRVVARGGPYNVTPASAPARVPRTGPGGTMRDAPDGTGLGTPWRGARNTHSELYGGLPGGHPGRGILALPPRAATARPTRRPRFDHADARRGIVLLTVLGPCRAVEPYGDER